MKFGLPQGLEVKASAPVKQASSPITYTGGYLWLKRKEIEIHFGLIETF